MEEKVKPTRFFCTLGGTMISGTANGCFAVITEENKCVLYNAKGEKVIDGAEAFDGILLNDGAYFLQHLPRKDSLKGEDFLVNVAVWSLYNKEGTLLLDDIDSCKIYANGWYRVIQNECNHLYRADHTLVAEEYCKSAVYENGYALMGNPAHHKYADWKMYTPEGNFIGLARDTVAILGNGLALQHVAGSQELFDLYNVERNEKIAEGVTNFYFFPNDRFILMFEEQKRGKFLKLYEPDGCCHGVSVQNAKFLPDGRFVQYHDGRVSALHRRDGRLHSDDIWSVKVAGNYYLIGFEGVETLFNDKGENLGKGYDLVYWLRNFTLLENKHEYHLFNQYGKVFTFPIP